MRLWLWLWILVLLTTECVCVQASAGLNGLLVTSSTLCDVSPYFTYGDINDFANWTTGTASLEAINCTFKMRIRQSGTIYALRMVTGDISGFSSFRVRIWRGTDAPQTFSLVAESEDILSALQSSQTNRVSLGNPMHGVQIGDYVGFRVTSSNVCSMPAILGITNGTAYYLYNSPAVDSTGYAWQDSYPLFVPIWVEMSSPEMVVIGDSITQGVPYNHAFTQDTGLLFNLTNYWANQVATNLSYKYQNMGHGSDTTLDILNRVTNDVVAARPRMVIMEGGLNDIINGSSSAQVLLNWTNIITAVTDSNIYAVVLSILPSGINNGQSQLTDAVNVGLSNYVATLPGRATWIDTASVLGQFRAGGDCGNLWDFKAGLNSDTWHLSEEGNKVLSDLIVSTLQGVAVDSVQSGLQNLGSRMADLKAQGVYLFSPNGRRFKIAVSDNGTLSANPE